MPAQIGIFGGSFNPPHIGHLFAAQAALEAGGLDEVIWVPTGESYHKNDVAEAEDRFEMTRLAVSGNPHFTVSRIDVERTGPTFSIDTVEDMRARYPGAELSFILGDEAWRTVDSWHRSSELRAQVEFIVVSRDGDAPESAQDSLRWVRIPKIDISSSACRARIRAQQGLTYWVPEAVAEYITEHKLYLEGA